MFNIDGGLIRGRREGDISFQVSDVVTTHEINVRRPPSRSPTWRRCGGVPAPLVVDPVQWVAPLPRPLRHQREVLHHCRLREQLPPHVSLCLDREFQGELTNKNVTEVCRIRAHVNVLSTDKNEREKTKSLIIKPDIFMPFYFTKQFGNECLAPSDDTGRMNFCDAFSFIFMFVQAAGSEGRAFHWVMLKNLLLLATMRLFETLDILYLQLLLDVYVAPLDFRNVFEVSSVPFFFLLNKIDIRQ